MINILRKNQKALWIVIALLCIPFVFYFSNSNIGAIENNQFGKIYGRPISIIEFQRNARLFMLARDLGMQSFLQEMVVGATTENQAYEEFTWNLLILRHEAERLGIQPTVEQVAEVVKQFRPFRGPNRFDPAKYDAFVKNALPTMGFSDAQIEELAVDQLSLQRMKDLLGTGVQIPETESKENYARAYGKLQVSVVRLRSEDLAKDLKITDEEVTKYYEDHKTELNTEEKRKVSFVTFALTDDQKKLAGKERVEVLQKLADKANDFNQALLEKGAVFEQAAAKFELPIQVTGEFTKGAPDPLLQANAQLAAAAFQLTPQEPSSDAMQVADAFYVLHLSGTEPARPLTIEEAKPKIMEAIKTTRTRELVSTKGAEAAQKIREAIKSGGPLEAAIKQAGLTMEKIPPFALADPPVAKPAPDKPVEPQAPDLQMIKGAVVELSAGEVSEVIPTPSGGVVAFVEKREPPDAVAYEAGKSMFNARFLNGKRDVAFYEWLRERRREAGVPPNAG